MSFDLNFETLRNYLDSVSKTINQHAQILSTVMREVKGKVSVSEMSEIMTALSNCVPSSLLPDRTVVHDPEDSELKRTLDNTTFHFAALGNAVGSLHEF
jgi:hypothetical protein